ncbi:MAG: ATP-binding protein [Candidatus Aenigmatarchaeota archaeon]|nr:MAG: ATP-binding protein [Candidatus Aenigmarchaeota archaeon]
MNSLRESVLRQELRKELDAARRLEQKGKHDEASRHYMKASAIYRRIAYVVPRQKSEEMFSASSQYESLSKTVKHGPELRKMSKSEPELYEEAVSNLIVSERPDVEWDQIGGLEEAKSVIKEAIILPFVKEKPPFVRSQRTILLYGPPGTGKSMLAKASSNMLEATFFEAKVSTLLSKYFGESPKLVNALFNKARSMQPSVIFIDELDSVAVRRSDNSNEATRRVLGELLTQIEGFGSSNDDKILVMGATNKPWDMDDAALSRFQRKIYVPLPDELSRRDIFEIHLNGAQLEGDGMLKELGKRTKGFSGRDIRNVCQEAISAMVREQNPDMDTLSSKQIESYVLKSRKLTMDDFEKALAKVRPASSKDDLQKYEEWKREFGG